MVPDEATVPMPGAILTAVASDTFQRKKVEPLASGITGGLAVKVLITGGASVGGGTAPETMT
jgi:hypothetical protein